MSTLPPLVNDVLRALYRLEDELDRREFRADEVDLNALSRLVSRWENDTELKIFREAKRAGCD